MTARKKKSPICKAAVVEWVQCDECRKWRTVPSTTITSLPMKWLCSMNTWNQELADCNADEEVQEVGYNNDIENEKVDDMKDIKKTSVLEKDDSNCVVDETDNKDDKQQQLTKKKRQKIDDPEELLKFAFDLDDGIIHIQPKVKKVKKEKEKITVINPTSVKTVEKSSDFITLEGTFPMRLHQIIQREGHNNIISWSQDGKSFSISDLTFFLTDVCSHYFDKLNYSNFIRKMEKHGFQRIENENQNINEKMNTRKYHHPKFQRDDYDTVKEIISKDAKGNKKDTKETKDINQTIKSDNKRNKSKKEQHVDSDLHIDGNDIIDNYERDHEIERPNFYHDIQEMMFGFGDTWPSNRNATLLTDRLVTTYITELAQRAEIVAETTGKLDKECFLYLVRKDEFKFSRVMKLINTNDQLRTIKKQNIDEEDEQVHDNADY